jgi:ATP-dependent RNA helicase DeaD
LSTPPKTSFSALGLPSQLLSVLDRLGHETPTPIQQESIPPLLQGRDVLGQAATGTGKTAAFALPLLSRLDRGARRPFETSVLVLVPTRELALQVSEAIRTYGAELGVAVVAVYGGQEIVQQLRPLKRGVDVVVATPGRAIDHLKRKTLKLDKVQTVVLDEADEMLDMGFAEELEQILSQLPAQKQTALFSATMPPRIMRIAERYLNDPVKVSIAKSPTAQGETPKVRQTAYVVPGRFKVAALVRLLHFEQASSALIFCQTRADVDELTKLLLEKGMPSEAIHGGLSQDQRDRVMKKFKSGVVKFLVATDVAARGLHVDNLSHVVNYDVPKSPEVYVHRIGRTGRAGNEGVALTLAEPSEARLIKGLERAAGGRIMMGRVPSGADLKKQHIASTQAAVLAAAGAGAGTQHRAWVETQAASFDAAALAGAAIELLFQQQHGGADAMLEDIPEYAPKKGATQRPDDRLARRPTGATHPERSTERPSPRREEGSRTWEPKRPARSGNGRAETSLEPVAEAPSVRAHHGEQPAASAPAKGPHGKVQRPKPAPAEFHGARAVASASVSPQAPEERRAAPIAAPPRKPPHQRASAAAPQRAHARDDSAAAPRPGHREEPLGRPSQPTFSRDLSRPARASSDVASRRLGDEPRPRRLAERHAGSDKATLFIGAGKRAGIRPGDLVGAIANESGLGSKDIGPIQIRDAFSLVVVPEPEAQRVIDAMRNSTLRGRRVTVKREPT